MSPRAEYDVVVVGAGPAGVTAAAAARNATRRIALIESSHRLGGSVSAAMHRSLCGLYSRTPSDPLDTLNDGLQRDLVARMMHISPGQVSPRQMGKTWVLEFPSAAWETSLSAMCAQDNIDRLMECRVSEVRRENDRIAAVRIEGAAEQWLTTKVVIDCTGGAVLQLAGEDVTLPPDDAHRMLGGYSMRWTGLTADREMLRLQVPYALARAVAQGSLPEEARFTTFYPIPNEGEGICKLAVHPAHFADGQVESFAKRVATYLQSEVSGFATASVIETSPHALPRDGRRLRGRYVMTDDDVLSARRHDSAAVRAWWPIEYWDVTKGPTYAYPPEGEHYDIPIAAQQSLAVKNLLAAGMCISATFGAAASARASGICLATGEAAGREALSLLATR